MNEQREEFNDMFLGDPDFDGHDWNNDRNFIDWLDRESERYDVALQECPPSCA